MKSLLLLVGLFALAGARPVAASHVTIRVHDVGCFRMEPATPVRFSLYAYDIDGRFVLRTIVRRAIDPTKPMHLLMERGFYLAEISSPRCWVNREYFVVGTGLNRTLLLEPGSTLPPPSKIEYPHPIIDYRPVAGVVVHAAPDVTKVVLRSWSAITALRRSGDIWYTDRAYPGSMTIELYVGKKLVVRDRATLQGGGFLEKFYAAHR